MADWIGYKWLEKTFDVTPVQRFRIDSQIEKARATVKVESYIHESYLPQSRPQNTFKGHLAFALKHEGIHLEFLARLFEKPSSKTYLEEWIALEPTGQYARRAGFLYEWLTEEQLTFSGVTGGNYINALDDEDMITASSPENNARWRVRDNLPGTRDYCPMVSRTRQVRLAESFNIEESLHELETDFGTELLMRSAVWLTIKESRASFAIEHEEKHVDRIKRFAAVMEQRCGYYENPLDEASLTKLQSEILGPRATRYGLRQSPVFVGDMDRFIHVVHYIAPHWEDTASMLAGLQTFNERTMTRSPLVRAAVASFGFVYIHPMSDGNGRISRFLINDSLRRDGALPEPFILPVSAMIISTSTHRRNYDQVLEHFSKPFMRYYTNQYRFANSTIAQDGIPYNLEFDSYADACFAWRYPDLTEHVEYLVHVVDLTIKQEMRKEANYLLRLRSARESVKNIIEGPDVDIDRIIRSVRENAGQVSNKLKKAFPILNDDDIVNDLTISIKEAFKSEHQPE